MEKMINLSDIPLLDFHAHIPDPNNISKVVDVMFGRWLQTAVSPEVFSEYSKLKSDLEAHPNILASDKLSSFKKLFGIDVLRVQFEEQLTSIPSFQQFLRYIAFHHGCKPTILSIDETIADDLKNSSHYISKVLERENIEKVVLDLFGETEINELFPAEKGYWVYRIDKMLQASWVRERGYENIDQVMDEITDALDSAAKRGCLGFKSAMAYNRSIQLTKPTYNEAQDALFTLSKNPNNDVKTVNLYQDFLLKHILKDAGEKSLPFLFHLGVGGPGPRPDLRNLDPDCLRSILDDPDLMKTRIVLLHCAYPYEKKAAVMAYQYSNLYIDLSIPTFFHGNLEQTLMTYLEFTPHKKLFYGSDAWHTPELFGFDAYFFKRALKNVLQKLSERYDVSEEENLTLANKLLSENAKNFLNL